MKKKDYIGKVIFELYKFKADSATISHFERLLNEITPDVFENELSNDRRGKDSIKNS